MSVNQYNNLILPTFLSFEAHKSSLSKSKSFLNFNI